MVGQSDIDDKAPFQKLSADEHRVFHIFTVGERQLGLIFQTEEPQRCLDKNPLLYHPVGTLDMSDLVHGHHDLLVVIIGMGIIKKPEVYVILLAEADIVAMDGTAIGSCIDFRIDIEKLQVRKGDKLVSADS